MERHILDKTDAELVVMSRDDPQYFGVLIQRYQNKLAAYARRITYFREEDIEDIVQEVFIKVYKNLYGYDERVKFSSWIYRITHNHIVDNIRKSEARPKTTSLEDNDLARFMKAGGDIEKEMVSKDCMEKVRMIIRGMPDRYREVMVLRFLEEKEYDEIMDILQKPKGSVATLIRRGRAHLKKAAEKENIDCI